ncbi:tetratricopeptide repeat protein 27 [Atheta coriaria]|uniref:tetratricopeptide repeat protein 27 n=1 Tax=Dalotia coriaria TaxID=877792 RepID=UPI0031F369C7
MAFSTKEAVEIPLTREILLDFENDVEITEDMLPFKINVTKKYFWVFLNALSFQEEDLQIVFRSLSAEETLDNFHFAISCLTTFVQVNFTGPDLDEETATFLKNTVNDDKCRRMLAMNNEDCNVNVKFPSLLVAAQVIFKNCRSKSFAKLWWMWRTILVHQKILDELSPTLLSAAEALQKVIKDINLPSNLQALFELEQAQLFCEFRSVGKAEEHINRACKIMGLKHERFGKLGKRTRYQEKDIAQLSMEVILLDKPDVERPEVKEHKVPTIVTLNDDVRLDKIEFANDSKAMRLPDLEQRILLILAHHMMISKPEDDLFYEEMRPFIEIILSQNNTWAVRTATLLLRCKLEAKQNRTKERSLMQCEEVVVAMTKVDPPPLNRVGGVYSTFLMPLWKTKEQYADLTLNLGLIKAALELYTSLQLWEEVIICYTILKMRHKSAEIIKEQLEIKPTVKLWCLLGDATDDATCYEKAWELSKRRSHRAQRHWGYHYFVRKQYAECISHFEKSVSINPLQAMVWLRLGFAALETQNWQIAATAYRRYTTLEPNGFEAWNNLAQAYLKLGNTQNAHRALKDALRCNFENWKIWENFLIVSGNIGNWQDMITSYHKLLDLKEKYLSLESLRLLVYEVLDQGDMTGPDMKKTQELLGRVTSIFPNEGGVWDLYARLAMVPLLKIQRLQRAYRCYAQGNWAKDPKVCVKVLQICLRLGNVMEQDNEGLDTVINSVRLNISSAITVVKKMEYEETKALLQEVAELL